MKLYIKEHIGFIALECVQLALISLILLLSGYDEYAILLYCVGISFFLLFTYLIVHYYNRRHMYNKLSVRSTDLQQLLEKTDNTYIGEALDQLTKTQYQLSMNRLKEAEDNQENHLTFINRWVHQMKTPLSVIELSAQELDEPESSNIREETDRLKNGLHTVLYMARMRTIQEDFQINPVNLKKLIQEVNQKNKRLYIRNEVYPNVTIKTDLTVETDEKWLLFMVEQLVHNAVKYTAERSKRIDLTVYKRTTGEGVLQIADDGVGIPAHDLKRVFQAFYTGDNGRIFRESTGVGLYLVKEVANYLGHIIEVESVIDSGTTLRICFTKTQSLV